MLGVIPRHEILNESGVEAMTKVKALLLSIVCSATAIVSFANQQTIPLLAFGAGAVLFFSILLYKYLRDHRIITQARRVKARSAGTAASTVTFTGGHWLSQAHVASLSREAYGRLLANYVQLGLHPQTQYGFLVSNQDRYAGTYIIGGTGLGKSKLLQSLIHQDIFNNQAAIVVDPHGDLAHDTIASLPPELPREWLNKIYLLDMEDEEYPFGLNVFGSIDFRSSVAFAQSVERIMHIFAVLWPEVMSQAYLPRYLRAAIIALAANRGATLVDMYTFLTNDSLRHRMLQHVHDPSVRQFWQMQYDDLSAAQRFQRVEPLVGRLESIFMGRSLVRNIVGRQTTISFRRAIENREVIFIKLPLKRIPQDARLVGTILLSEIHAALFSFADVSAHQRPGFSLYVDEFQNFATPDFSEMFTEGRKFGVRVTVAHQYRSQLPPYLQASSMVARIKVCFQVNPDDAREMAQLFMGGEMYGK